jgi:NADH-quinone oxidoreductase subunit H
MILMSAMASILFLGGWLPPFAALGFVPGFVWFVLKIALCLFVFLWARATLPRYRYDQLMRIGWKGLLPFALVWTVVTAGALMLNGGLPHG